MDIFNNKKVGAMTEELFLKDREIARLKEENADLRNCLSDTENAMKNIIAIKKTVPEDCTPGEYCRACEFGKSFLHHNYIPIVRDSIIQGYYCGKGKSCQHFVQKEVAE